MMIMTMMVMMKKNIVTGDWSAMTITMAMMKILSLLMIMMMVMVMVL